MPLKVNQSIPQGHKRSHKVTQSAPKCQPESPKVTQRSPRVPQVHKGPPTSPKLPQRSTKGHPPPQGYPNCPQRLPRVQPKGLQKAPEFTQVDLSRPSKIPKVTSELTSKFLTKLSGCPRTSSKLTYINLLRSPIWPLSLQYISGFYMYEPTPQ